MLGGGNHEATRKVCDQALVSVGTHVGEGLLVWQSVLLFEQQVLANLQEQNSTNNEDKNIEKLIKSQKERIRSLYKRQMRVPLLNVKKSSLIEEAAPWFDGEIDNYMKSDLDKALKRLETKLSFEESLLSDMTENQKLVAYKIYLEHLKNTKENPADVQSLYERAITDNALDCSLWEEYIKYMMEKFPAMDYMLLPLCKRSMRNCPWSSNLVELHIVILQQCHDETKSVDTLKLEAKTVLEKGLSSGVSHGSEAAKMWFSYLVLLRRLIKWDSDDYEKDLDFFRNSCNKAITFLDKYYGQDADLESEIPRLLARIEGEFAKDIQASRDVWNNIILQRNDNYSNAQMWLEFINLERSYGTLKHCRKLFRRALERVWDYVEIIVLAFRKFENETGNIESMNEFEKRVAERYLLFYLC